LRQSLAVAEAEKRKLPHTRKKDFHALKHTAAGEKRAENNSSKTENNENIKIL
jgi:hypothetical protein